MGLRMGRQRGWEILTLATDLAEVDVVPGKGGDILGFRWLPAGVDVLFKTPWGLPERGAAAQHPHPISPFLDSYAGGWQTIFPNGGDAGGALGFHGEAAQAAWDLEIVSEGPEPCIALSCRLRRAPFTLAKTVTLRGGRLEAVESACNRGRVPQEAMWSHHPAFGAPFISAACRLETAARRFIADDARDNPEGDLAPGAESDWPHARGRGEATVDLRVIPGEDEAVERFGYLTDLERGWARLANPELDLAATLEWDASTFPCAWLWLEAHATPGYPWFREVYALAVEPASSRPGQGLDAVRSKTGTQLSFEPGESKQVKVACTLSDIQSIASGAAPSPQSPL